MDYLITVTAEQHYARRARKRNLRQRKPA